MKEIAADLWSFSPADARAVTTNGFVTSKGELVMGGGCAKEARDRWPQVPALLGEKVARLGNHLHVLLPESYGGDVPLVSFPTKPATGPNGEPGFKMPSDLKLIRRSAAQIVAVANAFEWENIVIPRPGVGLGGLQWDVVKPLLADLLDDRFTIVTFAP
jgi:hypothetical protein